MTRRLARGAAGLLVVTLFLIGAGAGHRTLAAAQTTGGSGNGSSETVLAVVSPLVNPACKAAGLSTLLVPVVGGLLSSDLNLPSSVSISQVVLNALGPVFVMCAALPAPKGSVCVIDSQIVGIWPSELNTVGVAPPAPIGGVVDSVDAGLSALDLPLTASLENALHCTVPKPALAPPPVGGAPGKPSSDARPAGPSTTGTLAATPGPPPDGVEPGAALGQLSSSTPARPSAGPSMRASATSTGPVQLIRSFEESLSGTIRLLQYIAAALLLAFLAASWITTWRAKVASPRGAGRA